MAQRFARKKAFALWTRSGSSPVFVSCSQCVSCWSKYDTVCCSHGHTCHRIITVVLLSASCLACFWTSSEQLGQKLFSFTSHLRAMQTTGDALLVGTAWDMFILLVTGCWSLRTQWKDLLHFLQTLSASSSRDSMCFCVNGNVDFFLKHLCWQHAMRSMFPELKQTVIVKMTKWTSCLHLTDYETNQHVFFYVDANMVCVFESLCSVSLQVGSAMNHQQTHETRNTMSMTLELKQRGAWLNSSCSNDLSMGSPIVV